MPSPAYVRRARSPKASRPSLQTKLTFAPRRAAATAWFDPLPPGPRRNSEPRTVSPHDGRCGVRNERSATKLPITVTRAFAMFEMVGIVNEKARRVAGLISLLFGFLFLRRLRLFFLGGLRFFFLCRRLLRGRLLLRLFVLGGRRLGLRLLFRLSFGLLGGGGGLLLAGGDLVADEFEDGHLGGVAAAGSQLHDAGVAARTVAEAGAEGVEQLGHERVVVDLARGVAAVVHAVGAAEGDQALDLRLELLRLRERGDDALLVDERGELVAEHGQAMTRRSAQLPVHHSMSHMLPTSLYR